MAAQTQFPYDTRLNVLYKPLELIDEKALSDAAPHKWYNQTMDEDISLFTNDTTPARALCKLPKRWTWTPCRKRKRGGSFCHGLFADQTEIKG